MHAPQLQGTAHLSPSLLRVMSASGVLAIASGTPKLQPSTGPSASALSSAGETGPRPPAAAPAASELKHVNQYSCAPADG